MYDITFKYTAEYLRDLPTSMLEEMVRKARLRKLEMETQSQFRSDNIRPDLWKKQRKDVARMLTIINERKDLVRGKRVWE